MMSMTSGLHRLMWPLLASVTVVLVSAAWLVGCDALYDTVEVNDAPGEAASASDGLRMIPLPWRGAGGGDDAFAPGRGDLPEYACIMSTLLAEGAEHAYRYSAFELAFPAGVIQAAGGAKSETLFVLGSENAPAYAGSFDDYDQIVRMVRCIIPDTPAATTLLRVQLRRFGPGSWLESIDRSEPTSAATSARGPGREWVCNEWFIQFNCVNGFCVWIQTVCEEWEWVEQECPECGGGGPGGGDGGEPGGGSGGGDPDPCNGDGGIPIGCGDPEPCENTGDENVDNPAFNNLFEPLWACSNAGTPQNPTPLQDRRECGGWLYEDSDGVLRFKPARVEDGWTLTPCSMNPPKNWLNQIPSGAIGFVHTHPFHIGDNTIPVCGDDGTTNYQQMFSSADWEMLVAASNHTGNFNLRGFVVDGIGISVFGIGGLVNTIERCSY